MRYLFIPFTLWLAVVLGAITLPITKFFLFLCFILPLAFGWIVWVSVKGHHEDMRIKGFLEEDDWKR